jgi:hypothetical protein
MRSLLFMFLFSGFLLSTLSIPLILGKIPPNGLYGFRVKKTMENPEIWYPVNKVGGKWLLVSGIVLVVTAAGFYFIPGISVEVYSYAILAVWVVLFSIILVATFRFMTSLY